MKRLPSFALPLALFFATAVLVRADMEAGADRYVDNAVRVEIVRVQNAAETADFPPPRGMRRVLVEEVLKGIDTTREFLVPEGNLKAGDKAVVLFQFDSEGDDERKKPELGKTIWLLDAATSMVNIGKIPVETEGGWGERMDTTIPLKQIKDFIVAGSPEEVGLNAQVIDALLFPEKNKQLAAQDPVRANYVRFVLTLHDLGRDIPALSQLLESRDKATRTAAEALLVALAGKKVDPPGDETAHSLNEWSVDWGLVKLPEKKPEWPLLPKDSKMPKDAFPEPLLKAVAENDADAFAKAFPEWLDSGAMRDRQIEWAEKTLRQEADGNPFFEPDGKPRPKNNRWGAGNLIDLFYTRGYLLSACRLPADLAVNPKVPAEQRLKYMAMLAARLHQDRIAADQAARLEFIKAEEPGSEAVRRAAFWETGPEYTERAGSVALEKLAKHDAKKSGKLLQDVYFSSKIDDNTLNAAHSAINAGNKDFINALVDYIRTHHDEKASWSARLLCQSHKEVVLPLMVEWLKSDDRKVRLSAAENLIDFPHNQLVAPALIAALHEEEGKPPIKPVVGGDDLIVPRQFLLLALAMTGDPRGLDTLLAALDEPMPEFRRGDLIKGLARIGDKKALPALAKLAISLEWTVGNIPAGREDEAKQKDVVFYEAICAFVYIQTRDQEYEPDDECCNTSINMGPIQKGLPIVKKWQKEHEK